MNRRQLAFLILVNALISTVIALAVAFAVDARRPDPEELAALYTPAAPVLIVATPTTGPGLVPTFTPVVANSVQPAATPVPGDAGSSGQDGEIYVVVAGDSLLGIAGQFAVTLDALMQANQLDNPDFVFVGQRLRIPAGGSNAPSAPAVSGDGGGAAQGNTPAPEGMIVSAVSGVGDAAAEQILLVNDSDNAFNLQGWTLMISSGGSAPVYTFGNLSLFPGGTVRLHSRSGVDTSVDLYWGQSAALLAGGATLRLTDSSGAMVHSFIVP